MATLPPYMREMAADYARGSVAQAGVGDSARAARVNGVARRLGLPAPVVDADFDNLAARERIARTTQRAQADPTYASMMANERFAAAAIDDDSIFPLAQALSRQMGSFTSQVFHGAPTMPQQPQRSPSFSSRVRQYGWSGALLRSARDVGVTAASGIAGATYGIAEATIEQARPLFEFGGIGSTNPWLAAVSTVVEQTTGRDLPTIGIESARTLRLGQQEQQEASQVQYGNWYVNQAMRGVESVPQQVAALLTALRGNPGAAITMLSALSGGTSYGQARDQGVPHLQAMTFAGTQAGLEAAGEAIPIFKFVGDALAGSGFFRTLANQLVLENLGEQFTGHFQDLNAWAILPENADKTFAEFARERPDAALEIAVATTAAVGLQTSAARGMSRVADRAIRVAQDRQAARNVDKVMQAAAQSSTRTASPGEFEDVLAAQLDGVPGENLFIPAEAVRELFQSDDDMADDPFWSAYAEQLAQAEALGGDVVVPLASAATHLAGTPQWEELKDKVRASAGGSSRSEADEWDAEFGTAARQTGEEFAALIEEDRARMEPVAMVHEAMRDKLMSAGYRPDVANQMATSFAQRQMVRAQRMGRELTGAEVDSVEVRRILPESLARISRADDMDLVIRAMKKGKDTARPGPSLLEFIAARGGIVDTGGDVTAMGGRDWHKGKKFRRRLVRDDLLSEENTPDALALAAWEAGYFPNLGERPTVNDLLDAIDRELRGSPVYPENATDPGEDFRVAAQELRQLLDQTEVDVDTASPAEIKAAVERFQAEAAEGRGFDQDEPVAELSGSELGEHGDVLRLERAARKWYRDNLRGKSATSSDGAAVTFTRLGEGKSTSRKGEDILRAVPAIRAIIERGRHSGPFGPSPKWQERGVVAEHRYTALVSVAGQSGLFGVSVHEMTDGRRQYNLTNAPDVGSQPRRAEGRPEGRSPSGITPDANNIDNEAGDLNLSYEQSFGDGPRGRITFTADGKSVIDLFQSANLSTFIHESGHLYLEELKADAELAGNMDTPEAAQLVKDWQAVVAWFAKEGHPIGADGFIPTEAHEMWARGFERFTMEGKAPSSALKKAFEAFRSWMLTIYKVVDNLRSPITPEIRDVMTRLMATDEEIAAAAEEQNIRALFKTAEEAGMTEAEFAAYKTTTEEARGEAYDALLYRTMATIRAQRTKEYKEREATVRAEVMAAIDAQPVFTALRLFRTGKVGDEEARTTRLDKQWLIDVYGPDALDMLPRTVPPIYADKGFTHADIIAEQTGFASGDEMIRTLMGHEEARQSLRAKGDKRSPRQVAIDEAVAAEMAERYGDPLRDGSIEEEALALIHNDRQGEVIASELRALARRANRRPTPYSIARQWAADKIAAGEVRDVISGMALQQYQRAARRAGKAAEESMLKGDVDETFRQKQIQMLNNALISEGKKAKDRVDVAVRRLGKIARRKTSDTIAQDHLDQAHALLERVDMRPRTQRDVKRREGFATWAAQQRANGIDVVVPDDFAEALNQVHWSKLSVEALIGLDDTVKQIMHLGRLKQTLLDGQERRRREEIIAEMEAQGGGLKQRPPTTLNDPDRRFLEATKSKLRGWDAAFIKIEQLVDWLDGGNPNGIFNRMIFRPLAAAQAREADMMRDYVERINQAIEAIPAKQLADWNRKVDTPELINNLEGDPARGEPWVLFKDQIVMMAMNWGNAGNRQRLLDGYGWNERAVEAVFERLMTEDDWRFVQSVWDTVDGLWPDIEALEKRVNGVAPDKVEAVPVVTRFGTFRGGYFPAIYDPSKSQRSSRNEESNLLEANYVRATTTASATKARAEQVRRPILLNMNVITRHLGEVIHDITHREALTEVWRIVSDERVERVITNALGPEYARLFRPWLKHVANDQARNAASNDRVMGAVRHFSNAVSVAGLGYRITSVVAQIAGMPNIIAQIGERRMLEGWARFIGNPVGAYREVTAKSGEMRDRFSTMDRDIVERARMMSQRRGIKAITGPGWFTKYAFHGILLMDAFLTTAGWIGAYRKATAEGMGEDDAIFYADKVVRKSQGAGGAKDQAAIMADHEAVRLFVKFFSYFSALYSQQRDFAHRLRRITSFKDAGKVMHFGFWAVIMPPLVDDFIRAALKGELPAGGDDDDDDGWIEWASKRIFFGNMGSIPGVRDIGGAIDRGFGYRVSPVQGAGEGVIKLIENFGKAMDMDPETRPSSRWLSQTLNTIGLLFAKPTGQLSATAQFGFDVGTGEAEPENVQEVVEGVLTGRIED